MRRSLTISRHSSALRYAVRTFHPSLCATMRIPEMLQEKILFSSSSSSCPSMAGSVPGSCALAVSRTLIPPTTTRSPPSHAGRAYYKGTASAHRNDDQMTRRGLSTVTAAADDAATTSDSIISTDNDDDDNKDNIMFWYDRTDHVIGEALFGSINVLEATACLHYWLKKEEEKKQQRGCYSCSSSSRSSMVDTNMTTTHLCSTALHYIFALVERLHAVEWIMTDDEHGSASTTRRSSSDHTTTLFLTLQDLHRIVELWHDAEVRMHHHILHSNKQDDDDDDDDSYSAPPLELVSILPTAGRLMEQVEDIAQRLIDMGTAITAADRGFHEETTKQQQVVSLSIELYNFLIDSAVRASQGEEILRHLLDARLPLKTRARTTAIARTKTTPSLQDDFRLDQENKQTQQHPVVVVFTLPRPNLQSFLLVLMGYRNAAPTDHTVAEKAHRVLYDLLQQPDIHLSNEQQQRHQQQQPNNSNNSDNAAPPDLPFRLVMDVWLKADRSDSVEKCRQVLEVMSDAGIAVKASHFKPILEYCHEKEGHLHEQAQELALAMQQHDAGIEVGNAAKNNDEISNHKKNTNNTTTTATAKDTMDNI